MWMLAMRVATIPFPAEHHAYVINLCSGAFMAFTAFFLCRMIYVTIRFFLIRKNPFRNLDVTSKNMVSSFIAAGGALCFALCDSAWFSAVEAEVYAMSAFLSSVSLWIMLKWWFEKSVAARKRLLILVAYLTGLSLGVHQLNLLLIPVFVLIILYKRYRKRINPVVLLLWVILSFGMIGLILMVMIPGLLYGAESFELLGVNTLGLPYNSGVIIFSLLLLLLFIIILIITNIPASFILHIQSPVPNPLILLCFILLGFSSYGIILIRGNAYPPMNEGVPDNIFALSSYIARDQYPSSPLISGSTPYSKPLFIEEFREDKPYYSRYALEKGKGKYKPFIYGAGLDHRSGMVTTFDSLRNDMVKEKGYGYILTDYEFNHKLTPELDMWFPRMTSRKTGDRTAYVDWGGMTEGEMDKVQISEAIDSTGNFVSKMYPSGGRHPVFSYRPTYWQNFRYFVSYQSYYMYFRYLFWNFIGRQNDFHSNGEIEHGNFITGFPFIDNILIGDTSYYPDEIWKANKGRNRYFGIPFIIGIIGIIWLLFGNRCKRRILSIITLLFLMTGLAIVVYLNQLPGEPRERDYTFLVSYMAFAMWIASGFLAISFWTFRLLPRRVSVMVTAAISLFPATLMAVENFDDHDRRGRYEPTYFASSFLDFEYPSVIFSQGDNSTFPLWYASEVLNIGSQHSVVDITYLSLSSYIENLKKQGDKAPELMASPAEIGYGAYIMTRIPADSLSEPLPLKEVIKKLYKSKAGNPVLASSKVIVSTAPQDTVVIDLHDFTGGSSYLSFKHLMLLDMMASQEESDNPKALFFPALIDHGFYKPLDSLLKPALFGKIYAPFLSDDESVGLLKESVRRELEKIDSTEITDHYRDPLLADRTTRYRGELIIAANELLKNGETELPLKIAETIETKYPYEVLLPGTFTVSDTTFYEGKEYVALLRKLGELKGEEEWFVRAENVDKLMSERHKKWVEFYHALTPAQRRTLSNRSKRLMIP